MTRSRATARKAGTQAETAVAKYLATTLKDDRIERRTRNGTKDRGDITGLHHHGNRIVIEIKNCATTNLAQWTREATTEAGNDDAICGLVIAKKRGTTDVGEWYVHMTVNELIGLLTGQTPDR